MTQQNKAIIQMIICSVLWSIAGIFIKLIDCNSFVISGCRSAFSAITVFVFMRFTKIKFVFNKKVIMTAVFMSCVFMTFVMANKFTTAANAIVLQFIAPVFVLIISCFVLKQKLKLLDVIVTFITLLGIALFFLDQLDAGHILGNLLAILSGFFLALMFICVGNSEMNEKVSGTFFAHVLTAIVGIPFIFFTKNNLNGEAVFYIALLGVVQLGIPYILLCYASRHINPIASSLLSVIEPLLNPVWVAVFNGEMPGAMAFAGGIIILVTITVWCILSNKNTKSA